MAAKYKPLQNAFTYNEFVCIVFIVFEVATELWKARYNITTYVLR